MKKTTYILLGLVAAGFAAVIAVCIFNLSCREPYVNLEIGPGDGQRAAITLPSCANLVLEKEESQRVHYSSDLKQMFAIHECDSLTSPVLSVPEKCRDIFTSRLSGDSLNISVNLDALADTAREITFISFTGEDRCLARIMVPRGMLRNVCRPGNGGLLLENLLSGCLDVRAKHLTLDSCRIDTLLYNGDDMHMTHTEIGFMRMRQKRHRIKINSTCDSRIINLDIYGNSSTKGGNVNLTGADVDHIYWTPEDSDAYVDIHLSHPAEIMKRK